MGWWGKKFRKKRYELDLFKTLARFDLAPTLFDKLYRTERRPPK